jgi:Kelch motif/Galactose oxidase, central domain
LSNGKVLVAGGYGTGSLILNSAEVYDPATGIWTFTPEPMNLGRVYHTATLLPTPQSLVLVAGGTSTVETTPSNSAEIYSPTTGTWTTTNFMATARNHHTATYLGLNRVLVAGGLGTSGVYLYSAEIYDFGATTWASTGSLNTARDLHTATLLPSGQVLATGGKGIGNVILGGAELYEPATRTWTATGSLMGREYHTTTLLSDGRVVVAGGLNGSALADAELYDLNLLFAPAWQPQITSFPGRLLGNSEVVLGGSVFTGISEASGNATNNSATNYPLVQLRRLEGESSIWLLPDPAHPFSATSFTSVPLDTSQLAKGHYLLTVFANGIPSVSSQITLVPGKNPATTGALLLLLLD